MSDCWLEEYLHQVHVCKFLCCKRVSMINSALLQHSYSRSLPLSFTSASQFRSIIPLHIVLNVSALKSPKRMVDSLVLTLRTTSELEYAYDGLCDASEEKGVSLWSSWYIYKKHKPVLERNAVCCLYMEGYASSGCPQVPVVLDSSWTST